MTTRTLSALVLFLGLTASVSAQTVTGTVTDPTGAALPDAIIDATLGERPAGSTQTGADGRYSLSLEAGSYRLTARLDGFTLGTANVNVSGPATQDFHLGLAPLDDTVVVTASRTAQSQRSVTESLSVFETDDVERLGAASAADVIRFVPGLNAEATGREGELTSLFSRGGESDYNQVLIDGVQVNTSGGAFDFGRVSAAEIERLEVQIEDLHKQARKKANN